MILDCWEKDPSKRPAFAQITSELTGLKAEAPATPLISSPAENTNLEVTVIIRKVGQTSRGVKITANSLPDVIEQAKQSLEIEVVEIWDAEECKITNIKQLKENCIYYAATLEDKSKT